MKENQIKLNEIVSRKEMKQKKRGPMHALHNSLKRNTLYGSSTSHKPQQYYEYRLPESTFHRKDLSIMLRYLLYKHQMQLSDRNMLRRILVSIFDQDLICAGSKNFIHHLKLVEGQRYITTVDDDWQRRFYFILKGKGIVTSGQFSYQVKVGNTVGQMEILSNIPIDNIQFQSRYLLLSLDEEHFNEYFRKYFEKIYLEKQGQVSCIKEPFLDKIPAINKYLLLNKLIYKTYYPGDKITNEGSQITYLFFLGQKWRGDKNLATCYYCLGLLQLLKDRDTYFQTAICIEQNMTIPCIEVEVFRNYVINNINMSQITKRSNFMESFSFSALSSFQNPEVKERIESFMNVKRVKLSMNRNRLRTEPCQSLETSFKFLKPNPIKNGLKQRYKDKSIQKANFSQLFQRSFLVKPKHNNFL